MLAYYFKSLIESWYKEGAQRHKLNKESLIFFFPEKFLSFVSQKNFCRLFPRKIFNNLNFSGKQKMRLYFASCFKGSFEII